MNPFLQKVADDLNLWPGLEGGPLEEEGVASSDGTIAEL